MKRLHLLALYLLLRCAIAQSDLVLLGLDANDFEFVFLPGSQKRCGTIFSRRLLAIALAFRAPLLDFRNVAQRFDALGKLDERAEIGGAHNFALDDVVHLMRREEIRPDVVDLFQAQRKAAIFGVHFQNFGLHRVALLEFLAGMLNALGPTDVADVDQALEAFIHFNERAEIGEAAHASADHRANRETLRSRLPWIGQSLLQAERNALRVGLYFEHHDFDIIADLHNFRRMLHSPRPTHFADMNQTFDTRLELHKGAVIRDADN